MDISTIKMLVVNMRNQGMTFQAIADKLKNEYGITRTRQSIAGLYTRAVEQDPETLNIDKMRLILDVVGIYALGYNLTKTTEILNGMDIDITYQKVVDIIKNNTNQLNCVNNTMLANLATLYREINDPIELKDRLSYNGIPITDQKFTELISTVALNNIKNFAAKELARLYATTNNKKLVRGMCNAELGLSISDVEQKLKP